MTTLGLQTLADSTATDPESHSEATTPSRTHVETAQYVHGPDDTESSASSPYVACPSLSSSHLLTDHLHNIDCVGVS